MTVDGGAEHARTGRELDASEMRLMKYLFTVNTIVEGANVETIESLLEDAGIPCMIRNEHLSMAMGEIPFTESSPEIWILNDEDYRRAKELVENWRNSGSEVGEAWVCPDCSETIEGQFTSCWKCGRER